MAERVIRLADHLVSAKMAVHLAGVSIAYKLKGGGRYEAVAPSSLDVAEGEFVSIVGPTGCGKSTLLNAAAGLVKPSSGRIEIFGQLLGGINAQAGYLFQQDALMPWKTALENAAIGLEVAGVARSEAREVARSLLAQVGLKSFSDRYPHQLSGGQRKRVALAQMLVRKPKILLMDEPFGPLDAQTRIIMGDLLLSLWQQPQKPTLAAALDRLHGNLPPHILPASYSQARRFLDKMSARDREAGRMGSREIKNIRAYVKRDSSQMWPGDAYTADGHTLDAEVAHPAHGRAFRPELTTVIDIARQIPWPQSFTGRVRRNTFTQRWHGREVLLREQVAVEGPRYRQASSEGDPDNTGVWFGEAAGLIHAIEPASVIIQQMAADAAGRLVERANVTLS